MSFEQHDNSEISAYLTKTGQELTQTGYPSVGCETTAWNVARFLKKHGINPSLAELKPAGNNTHLIPNIPSGKTRWYWHMVCMADETVYDPLVGKPLDFDQYTREFFGVPSILRSTAINPEELASLLEVS